MIKVPNEKELELINIKMDLAYIKEQKYVLRDLEELKSRIVLENILYKEQEEIYQEIKLSQEEKINKKR